MRVGLVDDGEDAKDNGLGYLEIFKLYVTQAALFLGKNTFDRV